MDTTVTASTPPTVTSRPSDQVRRLLKENTAAADYIRSQMKWLGVEDGTLVELRTIEPETRAITRSIDTVVELSSNLTVKNRFGRIEQFTPQGVYLYPNALIPSMAATSEADVWLSAGTVKISSTKEKFEYRRFFYFDFVTVRAMT